MKIRKRDGRIVQFDEKKIAEAIWKAVQAVGGRDRAETEKLSAEVVAIANEKFSVKVPTVEDVQDIVEKVLIENGHAKVAKSYILYREQRRRMREAKNLLVDVRDVVDNYLQQEDWRVKENANISYSFSGLLWHGIGTVMSYYALNHVYPSEISKAHADGDFHLHDLSMSLSGYSYYRNETVIVRQCSTGDQFCLALEQLFDTVDSPIESESGFEIKYTKDYEVLDERGWTPIQRVLRHKTDKPLLSFNATHGHSLIITDDHPSIVLVQENTVRCPNCEIRNVIKTRSGQRDTKRDYYRCKKCNTTFSKEIENINTRSRKLIDSRFVRQDNYIVTPEFSLNTNIMTDMQLDEDDGWFIGLFLAEGWHYKHSICFELKEGSSELKKLEDILKKKEIKYSKYIKKENIASITVADKKKAEWVSNDLKIRKGSDNKNMPIRFLDMPDEIVGAMVSGIIDGDGVVRNDDEWVDRVVIRLTSKTLLSQIQYWLRSKNVHSSLSNIENYGEREYRGVKIKPKKQLFMLNIHIPDVRKNLFSQSLKINSVDFKYSKKVSKARTFSDMHNIKNIENDDEYVYDITTETHTFLCNGILTHNCAGWSLRQLLAEGFNGVPGKVESSPARHLRTAVSQMVNFIGVLQNEWAGAQAFSSVDTYLAPFVRADGLSYKDVKQSIQEYVYGMNITSRWGGQCVSEDTEVLTENGWKRCEQLSGEKIATFNVKTGKAEFLAPQRVIAYDFDGEMISLKNRVQDQLVTPEHRVLRKKFNSDKYEFNNAQDLMEFETPVLVPIAAQSSGTEEIDDDWVRLYAWLVSEGTFSDDRGRIAIYQSLINDDNCEEIRAVIGNLGMSWHEMSRMHGFSQNPMIRFRLNQKESEFIREKISSKEIPVFIKALSPRQIRLFIETYAKGDGHIETSGRMRLYTKSGKIRDQLQELCVLCGYGTTLKQEKNGVWTINIIRNDVTSITRIEKVPYKGGVWCPTTENGTFVARRNGKVFITGNCPFSNITLDWTIPDDLRDQPVVVGGRMLDDTYGDYQKEMDMINRAFIEVMTAGDMSGRVFTWPIPTYNITRDFDWGSENAKLLFGMTAKYGLPYFQNFVNSDLKPSDVRSMCCRLQLDLRELRKKTGGLFGSGESTGSIGVVTINLPRIGYVSRDDSQFFERLEQMIYLAKRSLEIKRKIVERNMDMGLLPYSKRYLGNLDKHFSTIGLVGMNEACLNFLGSDITTPEGKSFAMKVLDFMRDRIEETQQETGHIYNLEATPAEGVSYRLARIDAKTHPKMKLAGINAPYYTNSTHLPVGYTDDPFEALKHQDELQTKYTGGTVFHTFLGESIDDTEATAQFVKKIAHGFRLPYYTITPTFSVCRVHGYISGEHFACPTCGKRCEVYSRVVGYIRPVQEWNEGKQEEFRQRTMFAIRPKLQGQPMKRIN